jgi:peroxiredoxin Q/BCP
VYGISLDDVASQAAFARAQKLGFSLLSDPDGSAARKYGVLSPDGRYAARVTFILDAEGVVRHVDREVDVQTHGDDLLDLIEELE